MKYHLLKDNDWIVATAKNQVDAKQKAMILANDYNAKIVIMLDTGEWGYKEIKVIKPTKEVVK